MKKARNNDQKRGNSGTSRNTLKKRSSQEFRLLSKGLSQVAEEQELGALRWVQNAQPPFRKEFFFEEGIIRTGGFVLFPSIKAIYHWSDVSIFKTNAWFYIRHDRGLGSVFTQFERTFEMEFDDGNTCILVLTLPGVRTLAQDFFRYGIRSDYRVSVPEEVLRLLDQKIGMAQLKRIQRVLEAEGEVNFGRVTAKLEGISFDNGFFPWSRVEKIQFSIPTDKLVSSVENRDSAKVEEAQIELTIKTLEKGGGDKRRVQIPLREMRNYRALELLCKIMNSDSPLRCNL